MAFIYDLADTWNDGATTFTAIKMDVTDTASAAASLLLDLQVGGASRFKVAKTGTTTFGNSAVIIDGPSGTITAASTISINSGAFRFLADTFLVRDAAGVLAQRNGTNAQTFNLYNTYTDASNYERGFMKWNSNVLQIGAEAAGTGTVRPIQFITNSYIAKTAGGANYAVEAGSYVRYASGVDLLWSNNVNAITGITTDVGIKRAAAGQLQITDGSTGTGELIFIVPTTDPGITGALWNNAGTLSISA
jgi:hypothetical protein